MAAGVGVKILAEEVALNSPKEVTPQGRVESTYGLAEG